MKRFEELEVVGDGAFGTVTKCRDRETGELVAIKRMKLDQEEDGIPPTTLRELSILRSVSHPNIVKLEDVIIEPGNLTLVFEYLDFSLHEYLKRTKKKLDKNLIMSYSFQLLAGINTLHLHRIIHRDLKPQNILINREGILKVCDFGLARYFTIPMRKYSSNVVSIYYRAPELLLAADIYGLPVDVWSAACIIAEMNTGIPLFPGDSEIDQIHKIFYILGTPTEEELPLIKNKGDFPKYPKMKLQDVLHTDDMLLIDLLEKMFVYDPDKRITIQDAMNHPFFNNVPAIIRQMGNVE